MWVRVSPSDWHRIQGGRVRRGALRLADVPLTVRAALEAGEPSVNHVEQMAMSMSALLERLSPKSAKLVPQLDSLPFLTRLRTAAGAAWDVHGPELFTLAQTWTSDTARGWAAFAVPLAADGLVAQLTLAEQFADDSHFAVREWAWLGVRDSIVASPHLAISHFSERVPGRSTRLQRYASESTRPKGVWSKHIAAFRADPSRGLPLLDQLVAVQDRYVQTSVSNWLNDVSRDQPTWVRDVCARWHYEHGPGIDTVLRRAQRGLPD